MSRENANARERNRQKSIGNAFNVLRNHLPKQLRDRKPTKAETLKAAAQYISHLLRMLENELITQKDSTSHKNCESKRGGSEYVYQKGLWVPPGY